MASERKSSSRHLGYAAGGELVPYLAWRRLPAHAARRAGLLDSDGRERLAGRIVFPEVRDGEPIWLIGRLLDADSQDPRYLGLPGVKPLLGWEDASRDHRGTCLVEGPLDVRLVPSKLMLHVHQGMRG